MSLLKYISGKILVVGLGQSRCGCSSYCSSSTDLSFSLNLRHYIYDELSISCCSAYYYRTQQYLSYYRGLYSVNHFGGDTLTYNHIYPAGVVNTSNSFQYVKFGRTFSVYFEKFSYTLIDQEDSPCRGLCFLVISIKLLFLAHIVNMCSSIAQTQLYSVYHQIPRFPIQALPLGFVLHHL